MAHYPLCPNDKTEMQLRMDLHGWFYYCPKCGGDWHAD